MKILELYSGTGSVGRAAEILGYTEIVSLDITDKYHQPTHLCDIMDWDYMQYPPGHFDVIWSSPPCTFYSSARRIANKHRTKEEHERDLEKSDRLVQKTWEIIEYLRPKYYFMENPQSGELKNREVMRNRPYVDADYCKYGYQYRKRTRFWTNRKIQLSKCHYDCPYSIDGKKHMYSISCTNKGYLPLKTTLAERYAIPHPLLLELLPRPRIKVTVLSRAPI